MKLTQKELKQLQQTELEILLEVDKICQKHNIQYSLYCGSLLGAIRHGGFIPWDDDLDICMTRDSYNRFLSLWNKEGKTDYILQNKDNTPSFTQSFTKIRKNNTAFVTNNWEGDLYHTGIFIDIIPIDRIPKTFFLNKLFLLQCCFYQLLTREHIPEKASFFVKSVSKLILLVLNCKTRKILRNKLLKSITKYNNDEELELVGIECLDTLKVRYPSDSFNTIIRVPFEGYGLPVFKNWDCILSNYFGDYMQPPPKDKQIPEHHPIALSFDKNYKS